MDKKPKISVLNLTNRWGGMDILRANLDRQVFPEEAELVIVDALWKNREPQVKKYFRDAYNLNYVRQNDKPEGAYTNLAHADNQGFRACKGELIVLLQDYIWIRPDALYKFWQAHQHLGGNALISGVGHQYGKPGKDDITNPKGKITIFKQEFIDRPEKQVWADPRMRTDQGTFYETAPSNWEANYAAIPRKIIYELGGMDEQYDFHGFAWDNVNIAQRAEFLGYKTYIDQTNECRGLSHDEWAPDKAKVERKSPAEYHHQQMEAMAKGEIPIRLKYLD
jgi:hypothetical protein